MRVTNGTGFKLLLVGVCAAALAFGGGCKKGDADAGSGSAAGSQKPGFSDEGMAFMLGRKYAFACLYTQLDKSAEANTAISQSQTLAAALGITPPTLPAKSEGFKALRATGMSDELSKKKSAKVAAVYTLGVTVTDAWFGAMLGSPIAKTLGEVESNAKAAGVAESVYKAQLDAIKASAKPDDEAVAKLASDLEAYFKGL